MKFKTTRQLKLTKLDKYKRASDAHIQLKNSQEPKQKRAATLTYNPIGWHNYNFLSSSTSNKKSWLMNRGHLIGYQFSGLNNESKNLVPITTYLNQGNVSHMDSANKNAMLFYEQKLDKWLSPHPTWYLDYQVTPMYQGKEKLPRQIRISYVGYKPNGQKVTISLNPSKEKKGNGGARVVYLNNSSPNAKINYATGSATSTIKKSAKKPTITTFKYAGATLSKTKTGSYTVKVVKSGGKNIGYAKPNQTVYVTSKGNSKVYWFNKVKFPKNTNKKNVKNMTIQNSVKKGKKLSNTQ